MKKINSIMILLFAIITASATSLSITQPAANAFGLGSTNKANVLSYAVVSPRTSLSKAAPAIMAINAGSATATAVVQFYDVTAEATVMFTNSTTTLFVNNTNGFGSALSDVIIIQHIVTDSYEKRILAANSSATNLVLTVAPMGIVVPGDKVYRCTTATAEKAAVGTIFWGASTNTLTAGGAPLYVGQIGLPLLLEINSNGSDASINLVSGIYIQ